MRAAAANGLVIAEGNACLPFGVMLGLALYLVASRPPRRASIRAGALLYASLALRAASLAVEAAAGCPGRGG